ncbi:pantoate--beta-alanine ligase [Flavihumibacter stibioxidans]|uniref:Pantothenate synthetase n=1 Tax=Flavihumibacter stibioxidans TaxID=1834163 RepID=A0ABR7M4K6_9BACT|nr:pantoate--beta-alanine ligase [Flavihumibacter stibioxidans]MBC6489794.1 pantoate--beta-alanine ligase [Flavihumibacter stibioxidans]
MILFKQAASLRDFLHKTSGDKKTVGFVPTMGALHEGHLSLLSESLQHNTITVCSIFVNPTQFNDPADFEKYPVTLDKDIEKLENAGVDVLFLPAVKEIYPNGTTHLPQYDLGYLETILEGKYRPGHFQGVCQVMHRLLEVVSADNLYMGRKDYQQCMVVKKLLEITQISTRLHPCDTLREPDGLAMSSRNMRLNETERKQAVAISRVLDRIRHSVVAGPLEPVALAAEKALEENGFKVDYVAIAAADNLELLEEWDGERKLVTLAAAWLNGVRLIDNMLIP